MTDEKKAPKSQAAGDAAKTDEPKSLTAADVAKLVKRTITTKDKNGKKRAVQKAVQAKEVLAFRDYGDHVIVVTCYGDKLRGDKV